MKKVVAAVMMLLLAAQAFAQGDMKYRRFDLDDAACDVGILYKAESGGMDIAVSAIATGKGSEFRKWDVTDIRLRIAGGKLRPSAEGKFFVNKESFFRVPAAVVFAALGTQVPASGNTFSKGITRTGAAIGLGVLALTAKGDIAGERCVFRLDAATASGITVGRDCVEITIENRGLHLKYALEVGLEKEPPAPAKGQDYGSMTQDELRASINALAVEAGVLRKEQSEFRRGVDAQYDVYQRKIEDIETKRGIAYKAWYEREHATDKGDSE